MKKFVFGTLIALTTIACSNEETKSEEATENPTEQVDKEAVIHAEKTTEEVQDGINNLEQKIESLQKEVDSLLNDI